jgi:hypothetical protein
MKRREFMVVAGGAVAALPLGAGAQPSKIAKIGFWFSEILIPAPS